MFLILGGVFVASGALLVALGLPLMRRRVLPNAWWGLRVPATLAAEEVWYEVNAASGRDIVWLGIAIIVAALVLPLLGISPEAYVPHLVRAGARGRDRNAREGMDSGEPALSRAEPVRFAIIARTSAVSAATEFTGIFRCSSILNGRFYSTMPQNWALV